MSIRTQITKDFYQAFADGDRGFVEAHITDDFTFSAPPDPYLDRAGYFERCWPGAGTRQTFDIVRLIEVGDEVIVTYETKHPNASARGRNTEILTFAGDKIRRAEVYFGWTIG